MLDQERKFCKRQIQFLFQNDPQIYEDQLRVPKYQHCIQSAQSSSFILNWQWGYRKTGFSGLPQLTVTGRRIPADSLLLLRSIIDGLSKSGALLIDGVSWHYILSIFDAFKHSIFSSKNFCSKHCHVQEVICSFNFWCEIQRLNLDLVHVFLQRKDVRLQTRRQHQTMILPSKCMLSFKPVFHRNIELSACKCSAICHIKPNW